MVEEEGSGEDAADADQEGMNADDDDRGLHAICYLPVGQPRLYVACGGGSEVLSLVELETFLNPDKEGESIDGSLETVQTIAGKHTDTITNVTLSADGTLLACAGMDAKVSLYQVANAATDGAVTLTYIDQDLLTGPTDSIEELSWAPRGHVLIAGSADTFGYIWHANKGLIQILTGHFKALTAARFFQLATSDHQGAILAVTASLDGTVRTWTPETGLCRHVFTVCSRESVQTARDPREGGIYCLDIHPTEAMCVVGDAEGLVSLLNLSSGEICRRVEMFRGGVTCLSFGQKKVVEEYLIGAGGSDGRMELVDVSSFRGSRYEGSELREQRGRVVSNMVWAEHPGDLGYQILVCSTDKGLVQIWDSRNGALIENLFVGLEEPISSLKVIRALHQLFILAGTEGSGLLGLWHFPP